MVVWSGTPKEAAIATRTSFSLFDGCLLARGQPIGGSCVFGDPDCSFESNTKENGY
jgi:hypothetical protein